MKRFIKFGHSVLIFWGIVFSFLVVYFIYSLSIERMNLSNDETINIATWVDVNANGIREKDEPMLPGVCVWDGFRPDSVIQKYEAYPCKFVDNPPTDKNGQRKGRLPSSYCDMIYSFALSPEGYQPTTDLGVKGCPAEFGFVQEDVKVTRRVLSIDEFAQHIIILKWLRTIGIILIMILVAISGTKWLKKSSFRYVFTFSGILGLFPLCYFTYGYFLQSDAYLSFHGIADGAADIQVWDDLNGNGIREQSEPPLADVCVGYGYSFKSLIQIGPGAFCEVDTYQITDENGGWGEFLPGEDCSDGIYVYALAPKGYKPTTDMVVEGCSGSFGFTKAGNSVSHKVRTPEDYGRQEIMIGWFRNTLIALIILILGISGTIWLEGNSIMKTTSLREDG